MGMTIVAVGLWYAGADVIVAFDWGADTVGTIETVGAVVRLLLGLSRINDEVLDEAELVFV
jgi:hypothetical protein